MIGMVATARELLSYVLTEARDVLDRSPEEVGATVGVSGRTIRRLEDPGHDAQPRKTTLSTLASFYGLDAQFIFELAEWEGGEDALLDWLREQLGPDPGVEFLDLPDEARRLALVRSRGTGRAGAPENKVFVSHKGPGSSNAALSQLLHYRDSALLLSIARESELEELAELMDGFLQLDRRRRRLALSLVEELRAAREAERAEES